MKERGSMEEDVKVDSPDTDFSQTNLTGDTQEVVVPKKKGKRGIIIIAVILVVLGVAGGGFWIWHGQPSFCNAICHTPMDDYNATYDSEVGQATVDKWGNEVKDGSAMLAVTHREANETCLDCHVPTIGEQLSEGLSWVTGDYYFPLSERSLTDLTSARGLSEDEFCLNDGCHHVAQDGTAIETRDDLIEATESYSRNPHQPAHGEISCGECHKAHRASVNYCSQCHGDSPIPSGWLNSKQAQEIEQY